MKKSLAVLTSLALALPVCAVAPVTTANASDYRSSVISGHDNVEIPYDNSAFRASDSYIDPADATVKPVLRLDKTEIAASEAPGSVQTMNLTVSGADGKYAYVGLHIYYDDRLTIEKSSKQYVKNEMDELIGTSAMVENGELFFTAAGMGNSGEDGVLASMKFRLPEDAEAGNLYPVCIGYQSSAAAEDLFNSKSADDTGKLMQSYVFTQGIENGYFKVMDGDVTEPSTETVTTTSTVTTTTTKTAASSATTSETTTIADPYPDTMSYTEKIMNGQKNVEVPYDNTAFRRSDKYISPEGSKITPRVYFDKVEVAASEAPGSTQTVNLNVSGADYKYSSVGFHVYYDTRLTVGNVTQPEEGGSSKLSFDKSSQEAGKYFMYTMATANVGQDGVFASMNFTLPDDAKAGDLYPIGINYTAAYVDGFSDVPRTEQGKLMNAYVFSQGIENGYIKVVEDSEPTSLPECFKDIYDTPEDYVNRIRYGHENVEIPYNYIGYKETYQVYTPNVIEGLEPELSFDKLSVSADKAQGKTYKINLNVSGMDKLYNDLAVHIYYDTRLKVGEIGSPEGGASSEMDLYESTVNPGEIYLRADGWWSDRNPHNNSGRDGAFAEISFTLPDDAEPGDLYPIGISYMYKAPSMDYIRDVDYPSGTGNYLKYCVFSGGIENGYIKVTSDVLSTLRGDANLDNQVNIADAVLVMQVSTNPDKYAQGRSELSIKPQGEKNADVDGKTGLSNSDALLIQKFKLGLVETL